jgi:hypothetical protein
MWGICLSERIGAQPKCNIRELEIKLLEKRRGVTFKNKLRAQKEKKAQATRGLRGKSPTSAIIP